MTLRELLYLLREHLAPLIIVPILAAAVAAVYCWGLMPNEYTASTSLLVLSNGSNSSTSSSSDSDVTSSDFTMSQMIASDIGELANSTKIKDAAANSVGMSNLTGYTVQVESSTKNRVMQVNVTGPDPASAQMMANAVAVQVRDTAVEAMDLEAITIVEEASVPTTPSGPPRLMYTGVTLLAALFVVIFILVLLDSVMADIKTTEELEEITGLPTLTRVPKVKGL